MNNKLTLAKKIKLLVLDVDGVLSDGRLIMGNDGEQLKAFNVKDGFGIKMLLDQGIHVAIITGKQSKIVQYRASELGIDYVYQGVKDKEAVLTELCNKLSLKFEEVAFVGDDMPDLAPMQLVGFAVAVADAHICLEDAYHIKTQHPGGRGAVREVCDFILTSQNKMSAITRKFSANAK